MALYLGSGKKVKITTANGKCHLIVPVVSSSINGVKLLSSDNYILKDSNNLYITAKEDK